MFVGAVGLVDVSGGNCVSAPFVASESSCDQGKLSAPFVVNDSLCGQGRLSVI